MKFEIEIKGKNAFHVHYAIKKLKFYIKSLNVRFLELEIKIKNR